MSTLNREEWTMDDAEWERIAELGCEANTDREWFELATAPLRKRIAELEAAALREPECDNCGNDLACFICDR